MKILVIKMRIPFLISGLFNFETANQADREEDKDEQDLCFTKANLEKRVKLLRSLILRRFHKIEN